MPDRFRDVAWLWDELNRIGAGPRSRAVPPDDGGWAPHVDIHEREDALVLFLDPPGVKQGGYRAAS